MQTRTVWLRSSALCPLVYRPRPFRKFVFVNSHLRIHTHHHHQFSAFKVPVAAVSPHSIPVNVNFNVFPVVDLMNFISGKRIDPTSGAATRAFNWKMCPGPYVILMDIVPWTENNAIKTRTLRIGADDVSILSVTTEKRVLK